MSLWWWTRFDRKQSEAQDVYEARLTRALIYKNVTEVLAQDTWFRTWDVEWQSEKFAALE